MSGQWCGVVLYAYSSIPKITKSLQKKLNSTVNSSFMSLHLQRGMSTETLMNEIIQINTDKTLFERLRRFVNAAIATLSDEDLELLRQRFLKRKTAEELAENLGICTRTVYRKLTKALDDLGAELVRMGFTEERFRAEYGESPYIRALYARLADGVEQ